MDLGGGSVEVFVLELADFAAVHRVAEVGAEALDVEGVNAAADLLVTGEGDGDGAMLEFRVRDDILHGVHDLRDTGFVIGAEKGRSIGGDEGFSLEMKQFRELGGL